MMAQNDEVAHRYADALYGLASETGNQEAVGASLSRIASWLDQDKHAARMITSPVYSSADKKKVFTPSSQISECRDNC